MTEQTTPILTKNLADLNIEPLIYPRTGQTWQTAYNYYLAMRAGEKFPPITVTKIKGKYIIVDGIHRFAAIKTLQLFLKTSKSIEVEEIHCKNLDEAYVEAVKRNISHGRALSFYEKLEVRLKLEKMGWKHRPIAELLHMPSAELEKMAKKRTIHGAAEDVTLKSLTKNVPSTASISKENQKLLSGTTQTLLVKQLLLIIQEGWLDIEDAELRSLLMELRDALNTLAPAVVA